MRNLKNQRFGRLIAIYPISKGVNKHVIWLCHCSCGNLTKVRSNSLLSGDTKSCGCLHKEKVTKHGDGGGKNRTRLYGIWGSMKQRCSDLNHCGYKWYGKKGISICETWLNNYQGFKNWALSNGYADDLTIDRIDGNGNYEPDNCQWLTKAENARRAQHEKNSKKEDI